MPELPEVETVRRGLERLVVGKTIGQVQVRYAKMIGTGVDAFVHDLQVRPLKRLAVGASICSFTLRVECWFPICEWKASIFFILMRCLSASMLMSFSR